MTGAIGALLDLTAPPAAIVDTFAAQSTLSNSFAAKRVGLETLQAFANVIGIDAETVADVFERERPIRIIAAHPAIDFEEVATLLCARRIETSLERDESLF